MLNKKIKIMVLSVAAMLLLSSCALPNEDINDGTTALSTAENNEASETTVSNEEATVIIAESGKTDYVIIRPENDDDKSLLNAMKHLKNNLTDKYSVNAKVDTDWLNTKSGAVPSPHEILLGKTNREESKASTNAFKSDLDFRIELVGEKLVITGGSNKAVEYAVIYLTENLMKDDCFALDKGFSYSGVAPISSMIADISGVIKSECTVKELYPGVTSVYYSLSTESKYGLQKFTTVEFDPRQKDLYFRVTMGGETSNKLTTVGKTVEQFNAKNGEGLKAISATNGDLWMVSSAHARIEGKGTVYKDCSDAVVTKSLTIPRGFNMYNGEIISSSHLPAETPFEGEFYSFGVTEDGIADLGKPSVGIEINNKTANKAANADGLNRLPANNTLIMYSDVYSESNYSLSDALEIVIDSSSDYKVCHGEKITGSITAVTKPGDAKQNMKKNRIILTARGSKKDMLSGFAVGDEIEISISITEASGKAKTELWQKMKNAVGGHIPVIKNGISTNSNNDSRFPISVLGIKKGGKVVMLTNDGRQSEWSQGLKISQIDELCRELGIETAFLLDGGGSAEMVNLIDGAYKTVGKPSDKSSRAVVNTVILACGKEKQ